MPNTHTRYFNYSFDQDNNLFVVERVLHYTSDFRHKTGANVTGAKVKCSPAPRPYYRIGLGVRDWGRRAVTQGPGPIDFCPLSTVSCGPGQHVRSLLLLLLPLSTSFIAPLPVYLMSDSLARTLTVRSLSPRFLVSIKTWISLPAI